MTNDTPEQDHPPVILLIDDEKLFRLLARSSLFPGGFDIVEADSGEAAIELLRSGQSPSLILLDLVMPGMDGFATCAAIRNDLALEHVPILIMTGLEDYASIDRAYKAGATDFITKPINWQLLTHRVRYMLRASKAFDQVKASEKRVKGLIEAIPDALLRFDTDRGRVLDYKQGRGASIAHTDLSVAETNHAPKLPSEFIDFLMAHSREHHHGDSIATLEYSQGSGNEEKFWEVRLTRTGDQEALALIRDVTDRRRTEHEIRQLSRVVEQSPTSIMITDIAGRMAYVNPRLCELTGYRRSELIGENPRLFASGDMSGEDYERMWQQILSGKEWRGEFRTRRKDGSLFWERASISAIRDDAGQLTHFLAIKENITDYKETEKHVRYLAYHDRLTGLPNRVLFREKMQHALAQALRSNESLVLMLLDIDDFKRINDTLGHDSGDLLLRDVADKLLGCFRQSDILTHLTAGDDDQIARIGGDEFAVCLSRVSKAQDATIAARRILTDLATPFVVNGQEVFVNAKIGIAVYPQDGEDVDTLLKNAEAAMYHVRRSGQEHFQFYSAAMNASAARKLSLESHLRRALDRDELRLAFQAQVDAKTMRVVGAEVLMRWENPRFGFISPVEFIPLAEEYGLIEELGEWVLWSTLVQAREWRKAGFPPIRFAINVSGHQLRRQRLLGITKNMLSKTGIDAQQLEFELTESSILQDTKAARQSFYGFKDEGIRIAIDDFGTGYSSLSYLRRFPLDLLKMDKSFVDNIGQSSSDAALSAAIIDMGHSLGLEVLAEGVETDDQLEFLRQKRCDLIQGFVVARPSRPEQFAQWAFGQAASHDLAAGSVIPLA